MPPNPPSTDVALPLSSLLPPSPLPLPDAIASATLGPRAAVLGPLPATAPLHAARAWIEAADLPPFERGTAEGVSNADAPNGAYTRRTRRRVLVITGPKGAWHTALEDADESWLRTHGGERGVRDALGRVDVRYCPSPAHARLLLTVVTGSSWGSATSATAAVHEVGAPGLVVLYDLGALFVQEREGDENAPPDGEGGAGEDGGEGDNGDKSGGKAQGGSEPGAMVFAPDTTASAYFDLVAAGAAAAKHFGASLLVLEPSLPADAALPILPPGQATSVPAASRERRVPLADGLGRILGAPVGRVQRGFRRTRWGNYLPTPATDDGYALGLDGGVFPMAKRRCGRGEFATAPRDAAVGDELDEGGWEWVWC